MKRLTTQEKVDSGSASKLLIHYFREMLFVKSRAALCVLAAHGSSFYHSQRGDSAKIRNEHRHSTS
jgi:hypothetical protein